MPSAELRLAKRSENALTDVESLTTEVKRLTTELAEASATKPEAKAEEHHDAPLPPELAKWEPIAKTDAVKKAAEGIKELEAAFARNPTGEAAEACSAGVSAMVGPAYAEAAEMAIQPRSANLTASLLGFAQPPGPSDGVGKK